MRRNIEQYPLRSQLKKNSESLPHDLKSESLLVSERTIIEGKLQRSWQDSYEDKEIQTEGPEISEEELEEYGIGFVCKKGLKPDIPNQDDFSIILDPDFKLFSVFDGHGESGHQISNYIRRLLPKLLVSSPNFLENPEQVFQKVFQESNERLHNFASSYESNFETTESGTTATVALLKEGFLYLASVGDSGAVLGLKDLNSYQSVKITQDHKPDLPLEKERIMKCGGEIKKLPDDIPYRVFKVGEDGPGLSISRSIGDFEAEQVGVIACPEVKTIEEENAEYLIICSDGIWEFISDREAVELVAKWGTRCKRAAEELANLAWTRWIDNEIDIVDDLTAIVIYLPLNIR